MTVNNQNNVKNQNIVDEEGETSNQPLLTTPENDHQEASTSENHAPAPSAPPYYLTESVANNAVANQHANRFMQFLEMAPNVTHFYSALVPILDGFYMPVQPAEELDSLIPILDGFHMPVQPAEELDSLIPILDGFHMPVQPAEELDSLIPILDGFHMPVQPAEELDWSHAPSCAFPDPFGSIDDFIIEDEYEEDSIEDIIGALDNIILARPRSEVELKIEGCQFIDVDIYTFAVTNDAAFMSDDSSDEDQSTPDCSSDEESS